MKKAEEKPAVEMTVGGKPKSGASHPPWKSLRDSHIPTARRLLYIFKTFARKEPSSAIASGYGFRLILRLEKTVVGAVLTRITPGMPFLPKTAVGEQRVQKTREEKSFPTVETSHEFLHIG